MGEGAVAEKHLVSGKLPLAALLLLVLFHLATARLGIDYGKYWDEHFFQRLLADSVAELDAWPRKYFYGSLYAGMGYLAFAPEWIRALPELTSAAHEVGQYDGRLEPTETMRRIQDSLHQEIYDPAFLIRARSLFALAASTGIVFLFFAGRRLGRSPWSGTLAAAVLALSWEFESQARHIAIDGVLVALVAGFLALLARALVPEPDDRNPDRWFYLAAIECGFATGAKFHAALLLVPLAFLVSTRPHRSPRERLTKAATCVALAGLTILIVNPGLLFDTVQVANDWGYTARDYWRDTDPMFDPYKSTGHLWHLREATVYVTTAALSPTPGVGLALFGTALFGLFASWRRDWKTALALGAFVPLYLFVMSRSGLILARNYLPVLPVLAIFVMWGMEALWLHGRAWRALAAALCALWVVGNAWHIASTALSVRRSYDANVLVADVRHYIVRHGSERFLVSRGLVAMATRVGASFGDLPNARGSVGPEGFDYFVYLAQDFRGQVPGVPKHGYFRKVFGSREVNYDYYPDWIGRGLDRRAYMIDRDTAERLLEGLPR